MRKFNPSLGFDPLKLLINKPKIYVPKFNKNRVHLKFIWNHDFEIVFVSSYIHYLVVLKQITLQHFTVSSSTIIPSNVFNIYQTI